MRWLSENYKWLFDGVAASVAIAVIGYLFQRFRKRSRNRQRQTATLTAQGAKVTNSPVASGANISQTINSPTVNMSLTAPTLGAPGRERYGEWRELIDELHESLRIMANAFAYRPPPGIIDVEEREDYRAGIHRGHRVLGNRILIADVLKNAGMSEKFQSIVAYAVSAHVPRDPSQRGCPTRVGFDLKASKFEDELMELARKDSESSAEKTLIPPETGKMPMQKPKLQSTAEPRTAGGPTTKRWDVFISHATEDKEEIAQPLAEALKRRGFLVWYDVFTLKLGDSLRESIDRGLAESRFGVVILSKHFFAKRWPSKELNGLTAIEVGGEKVILPVWHGVTHDDVVHYSPTLADRKAVNTGEGLDRVVAAIEEILNPPITEDLHEQLHEAEETLQGYRCPCCGSPLSTRSSVPLSEHDDGLYEDFECGYAHIDGHMQCPCPSDPKFPKLDDYEFVCKELQGDSYWKWECFANAKTREARMLSLMRGLGRTKEEAREQVEKRYDDHAKPWRKR